MNEPGKTLAQFSTSSAIEKALMRGHTWLPWEPASVTELLDCVGAGLSVTAFTLRT